MRVMLGPLTPGRVETLAILADEGPVVQQDIPASSLLKSGGQMWTWEPGRHLTKVYSWGQKPREAS